MQKYTWEYLAQMGAALGVIISLGLVAYEMKQARERTMANLYLERSAQISDILSATYSPETYTQARLQEIKDPKGVTFLQATALETHRERFLIYAESMHFLHVDGLTSEEEWSANKKYLESVILTPCVALFWFATKHTWRESFAPH